jgi:hypothetical protein
MKSAGMIGMRSTHAAREAEFMRSRSNQVWFPGSPPRGAPE